jgi:hypothetical protein
MRFIVPRDAGVQNRSCKSGAEASCAPERSARIQQLKKSS